MDSSSSEPSSMLHVRASTMYPLPISDDDPALEALGGGLVNGNGPMEVLPFPLLCGEARVYSGRCVDGILALTNYRFYLQNGERQCHVPLGLIEQVEVRDMFYLHVWCKDARSYRCTFDNNDQCADWFRRLTSLTSPPRQLQYLFAFCFYAWASEREHEDIMQRLGGPLDPPCALLAGNYEDNLIFPPDDSAFRYEVERLGFDLHGAWRISNANLNFKLCPSYPPQLLVPACISDDTLETVARFRSSRRIPAVVWRHAGNGAVIARCSQPEVGWLGWRSSEDEDLLKAIADACAFDKGPRSIVDLTSSSTPHTPTDQNSVSSDGDLVSAVAQERPIDTATLQAGKKVLIMDARSYTTAVANRARGGGCECPEYYPSCDIQFMNLANIHSIRKSFHALRQLCSSSADQPTWWSLLEGTRWLQHMSGLMRAAVTLVAAVEREARPVLVHCSDGWDRTPQIVALGELLLDPYYRTIEGFRVLVEREWLAFGHKFADRCGHGVGGEDLNERCPVFLQWLDCVHQLTKQFPCSFQFANTYLVKLAQHIYSNLFGTFLCNTKQERVEHVYDKTFSVWRYLNAPCFKNHLYAPPCSSSNQVLWPACNVRDLQLWSDVYIGTLESTSIDSSICNSTLQTTALIGANGLPIMAGGTGTGTGSAAGVVCAGGVAGGCVGPAGCGAAQAAVAAMTKTRSYGDLMGAAGPCATVRRCSDPSISIDPMKISSLSISSVDIDQSDSEPITEASDTKNDEITTTTTSSSTTTTTTTPDLQQPLRNGFVSDDILTTSQIRNGDDDGITSIHKPIMIAPQQPNGFIPKKPHDLNGFKPPDLGFQTNYDDLLVNAKLLTNNSGTTKQCTIVKTNECYLNSKNNGSSGGDINHNDGEQQQQQFKYTNNDDNDESSLSDNEERSESKSEITLCASPHHQNGVNGSSSGNNSSVVTAKFIVGAGVVIQNGVGAGMVGADTGSTAGGGGGGGTVDDSTTNVSLTNGGLICAKSNETSTDTLVADQHTYIASEICEVLDRSEPIQNGASDGCEVCAQNRKLIGDKHFQHSRSTSGKNSRYSTPPPYSRTPSAGGSGVGGGGGGGLGGGGGGSSSNSGGGSAGGCYLTQAAAHGLDVDGLIPLRSDVQHRLWQIQEEHRIKEEALQRELHTTRMALIKQVCHNCNHNDTDRPDDTFESDDESSNDDDDVIDEASKCSSRIESPMIMHHFRDILRSDAHTVALGSLVGSVCSTGDGQASVGDSLPSDLSWEALDDGPGSGVVAIDANMVSANGNRTLWVPDHAVSRCTGCHTEFWLGRRKHHCRNCGRIFCADCSENSTPLPNEQLYNPVRVCTTCYVTLRRNCPNTTLNPTTNGTSATMSSSCDVPEKCKHGGTHAHTAPPAANAQLTASSN